MKKLFTLVALVGLGITTLGCADNRPVTPVPAPAPAARTDKPMTTTDTPMTPAPGVAAPSPADPGKAP